MSDDYRLFSAIEHLRDARGLLEQVFEAHTELGVELADAIDHTAAALTSLGVSTSNEAPRRILIISGSREDSFDDVSLVDAAFHETGWDLEDIALVVHGAAKGVDRAADRWATEHRIPVKPMPANWTRFGTSAGKKRNGEMADYVVEICQGKDFIPCCLAIPGPSSVGTWHMAKLSRAINFETHVYRGRL